MNEADESIIWQERGRSFIYYKSISAWEVGTQRFSTELLPPFMMPHIIMMTLFRLIPSMSLCLSLHLHVKMQLFPPQSFLTIVSHLQV